MKHSKFIIFFIIFFAGNIAPLNAQNKNVNIALLKYNGGGDWYANPTSLTNLIAFSNQNLKTNIAEDYKTIEVGDVAIFDVPFVHLTGHGNVVFNESEVHNLRQYLISGGFLHISDNYGLDSYIRREMKKVFPESEWVELSYRHPIYHCFYDFKNGLPKIHEHDDKPAQGFALFYKGRMVCFYDYESDLGDGWEDADVHNDSKEKRQQALKMGANILYYVFNQ